MPGRHKQPLAVIQGKGKSNHLTKEEISNRMKQEAAMNGFADNIVAPQYLSESQKEEFNSLSKELIRLKIFSNLDVDNLARYIDSRDQYISLVTLLRKTKPSKDIKYYSQLQRTKNSLFNECRSAANDLGLTITSRLKLIVPDPEQSKEKSIAQKRFGDRL